MKATIAAAISVALAIVPGTLAAQSGEGNAARGERVFNQCKTCHAVTKDAASPGGPTLFGVFGRKAGTAPKYEASEAIVKSGIVWDDKTMAEYLKDPKGRVPGTTMAFAGVKQQMQLDDVIAYIKKATQ